MLAYDKVVRRAFYYDARPDPLSVRLLGALPEMGMIELPVTAAHAAGATGLPLIHRDPFDRLLIAQSMVEPLTLLTNDGLLGRYRTGVHVV